MKTIDGVERTLGWRNPGSIFGEVPLALSARSRRPAVLAKGSTSQQPQRPTHNEQGGSARIVADQLLFAPSNIHDQIILRRQLGSGLCANGIRILASPCTSDMMLLSSGLPGITMGPNLVPFIKPS